MHAASHIRILFLLTAFVKLAANSSSLYLVVMRLMLVSVSILSEYSRRRRSGDVRPRHLSLEHDNAFMCEQGEFPEALQLQ